MSPLTQARIIARRWSHDWLMIGYVSDPRIEHHVLRRCWCGRMNGGERKPRSERKHLLPLHVLHVRMGHVVSIGRWEVRLPGGGWHSRRPWVYMPGGCCQSPSNRRSWCIACRHHPCTLGWQPLPRPLHLFTFLQQQCFHLCKLLQLQLRSLQLQEWIRTPITLIRLK